MKLLDILANPNRMDILKLCSNDARSIGVIERKLKVLHSLVWRNVGILNKAGLVKIFLINPKDNKNRLLYDYIGGPKQIKLIKTTISKKHIQEIDKELNWMRKLAK